MRPCRVGLQPQRSSQRWLGRPAVSLACSPASSQQPWEAFSALLVLNGCLSLAGLAASPRDVWQAEERCPPLPANLRGGCESQQSREASCDPSRQPSPGWTAPPPPRWAHAEPRRVLAGGGGEKGCHRPLLQRALSSWPGVFRLLVSENAVLS